ncbi:MAG: GldG family protein [Alphaproteobacteria bacterium]
MKRRSAILLAGALLALLFVTANLLVSRLVGGRQLDATASGRYTLTEESLKTVAALRQPVTIRLYVSEKLQSAWDELGAHAARTTAFLARCVLAAPDKIRLEIRRIKPFSDMEKQAVSEGMLPFPENEEELYFGLKVIAADGRSALIPALKPERRALLESDLNRILHGLNEERKVKIGVFSPRLPFSPDGKGSAFASLAALLQEYYEVFEIPAGSSLVPQDISVVLALDPGRLPPVFAYALDQYVMRGGKVVFLVDPYSEVRHALQGYPPRPDAEMGEYLKTWGIDYHAERVAGDVLRGERVKGGDGRYRVYPLWFWAKGEDGRPLRFHTPGSLLAAENFADLHFSELAATGGQSGDIAAEKIRYASKTQVILDYNQDNKKRVLALLAEGKFRSHYRGGILDKAKSAQPYLPFAVRDAAVAVVADSDFAADELWVASRDPENPVYGIVPYAGNAAFLLGLIDRLSGRAVVPPSVSPEAPGAANIAETLYLKSAEKLREEKEKFDAKEAASSARLRRLKKSLTDSEDVSRRREIERAENENRRDRKALQNLERQIAAAADDRLELFVWLCFVVFPSGMLGLFFATAFFVRRRVRRQMMTLEKEK